MALQSEKDRQDNRPCLVGTLGMFIMDQFRFEDEQTGEDLGDKGLGSQIGGGGTYFAIGARMWLPPSEVLMTVDRGSDFTEKEQEKLDLYAAQASGGQGHSLWRYRERKEGTTRAVNIYRGQERGFAYLTPKLRLDPRDLLSETSTSFPLFIHCICSPERAMDICDDIDNLIMHWYNGIRPRIIWEPIPDSAINCLQVIGRIDVLSPNHEEAAGFLSVAKSDIEGMDARSSIRTLLLDVLYSKALLAKVEKLPVICIRSGALGALVSCNREEAIWVDAYHEKQEADRVVDVTGGGNSWLGGFAASLASRPEGKWSIKEVEQAAQKGSVSASFIIEQQSLPSFAYNSQGVELWNHEQVYTRLHHLQNRTPLESQL